MTQVHVRRSFAAAYLLHLTLLWLSDCSMMQGDTVADDRTTAEQLALALAMSVWAVVLFGGGGYWFGGAVGMFLGVVLAAFAVGGILAGQWFFRSRRRRQGGNRRPRGQDWMRLLEHEKYQYARQLEREGETALAEAIYTYLVNKQYPAPLPYERLAARYRARGDTEAERHVLAQAAAVPATRVPAASGADASKRFTALRKRYDALSPDSQQDKQP